MKRLTAERMRPIRDEVYERIRKAIIRGHYKPGQRLQEKDVAEELGTSRTPVREALRKLEVERFVQHFPHKGTVVSEVSLNEVDELYQVRQLLEIFIARRAALNATPEDVARLREILQRSEACVEDEDILNSVEEFNDALFELSDAVNLIEINRRIRETLQRVMTSNHLNPVRRKEAHREHELIVEALEAHDPDLAEKRTIEHLAHSPRTGK